MTRRSVGGACNVRARWRPCVVRGKTWPGLLPTCEIAPHNFLMKRHGSYFRSDFLLPLSHSLSQSVSQSLALPRITVTTSGLVSGGGGSISASSSPSFQFKTTLHERKQLLLLLVIPPCPPFGRAFNKRTHVRTDVSMRVGTGHAWSMAGVPCAAYSAVSVSCIDNRHARACESRNLS